MLKNVSDDDLSESTAEFLKQYYNTSAYIPREILLSTDIAEPDIIESWLRGKKGSKVTIASPKRGEKKQLVEMARKNADLALKQLRLKMASDEERINEELKDLQDAIHSQALPRRIEAYDISNIQGFYTVASLVVFENGQPKKSHYRKFKITRPEGKPDDYASMREVITRRLTGTLRRGEAFSELPDLVLIDGGKGQLNAALDSIADSGEIIPAIIGLAKQNEEIFLPTQPDPVILPRNSKALHLVQRIRDEAHRFAITFHRASRGRAMRMSILNDIPGIGPKRRRALIRHFGSLEKIRQATVEELQAAPSMSQPAAQAVFRALHQEPDKES
jgi:excinuclease ABC subunit C